MYYFKVLLSLLIYLSNLKFLSFYELQIKGFRIINETNDFFDLTNFKMVKVNKSMYALNGPVEIKQPEPEDMMISIILNKKLANGYTPSSLCRYENEPLCPTVLSDRFEIFQDLFQQSNMPFSCPHDPGWYNITNYRPSTKHFPTFIPGRDWRLDVMFIKDYTTVAGCQLFVQLID